MDQHKLISIVKNYPQIWNRTHPQFREREVKDRIYTEIGKTVGCPGNACREIFKSIREKYIREREKSTQLGDTYRKWDLLDELRFLDPYIHPRKPSLNCEEDLQTVEEYKSKFNLDFTMDEGSSADFDLSLVSLVKKAPPLWDRKCNSYPNRQVKINIWQTIANTLNKDMQMCMLRWKGLREKYIRQKIKFQEGTQKWELLDEMSFLDRVIQYRKRTSDYAMEENLSNTSSNHSIETLISQSSLNQQTLQTSQNVSKTVGCFSGSFLDSQPSEILKPNENTENKFATVYYNELPETSDDNSVNDSSNDFLSIIKQEDAVLEVADSSYDSGLPTKRSNINPNEISTAKKAKTEEPPEKTPEQLFGDLVVAMLKRKSEAEKNAMMIEIMKILTK